MIDYPLSRADPSDYVAADGLILDEIRVLSRPDDTDTNGLIDAVEPHVRHFGDIIGGLTEEQVGEVMRSLAGIAEQAPEDQQEIVLQFMLRAFTIAARTAVLVATRDRMTQAKNTPGEEAE